MPLFDFIEKYDGKRLAPYRARQQAIGFVKGTDQPSCRTAVHIFIQIEAKQPIGITKQEFRCGLR